jgi:hypothetical protein
MRWGIVALVLATAGSAWADGEASRLAADTLFNQGRTLLAAGKIAEACGKLEASMKLLPRLGTLLNLADCHEKQGKIATAYADWREASAMAKQQKDDRGAFADSNAARLQPKLPQITVTVAAGEPPGLAVTCDGAPVDPALYGTPFPIDPGEHTVEATATGYGPWTSKVVVQKTGSISVPLLTAMGAPVTPVVASPPADEHTPTVVRAAAPEPLAARHAVGLLGGAGFQLFAAIPTQWYENSSQNGTGVTVGEVFYAQRVLPHLILQPGVRFWRGVVDIEDCGSGSCATVGRTEYDTFEGFVDVVAPVLAHGLLRPFLELDLDFVTGKFDTPDVPVDSVNHLVGGFSAGLSVWFHGFIVEPRFMVSLHDSLTATSYWLTTLSIGYAFQF